MALSKKQTFGFVLAGFGVGVFITGQLIASDNPRPAPEAVAIDYSMQAEEHEFSFIDEFNKQHALNVANEKAEIVTGLQN